MESPIFDCNCAIGPAVTAEAFPNRPATLPDTDPPHWTAASLIREMDYFGISAALVYHKDAELYHPRAGNARLMEEIAPFRDRLHPCWVVLPHHTAEMPAPDALIEQMDAAGVRAVRMYPWVHNFNLGDWSCGSLLSALEQRGTPVFVDLPFVPWPHGWAADLLDACRRHPRLNLVLSGRAHWQLRSVYPLIAAAPNLHFDVGWLGCVPFGIADLARRCGAQRILFGTRFPPLSPGSNLAALSYADLPPEERRLIAGGNLARLLGVPLPAPRGMEAGGRIALLISSGLPLTDHHVADCHVHMGPAMVSAFTPASSEADVLASMDRIGIEKACINSMLALESGDMRRGNDEIAANVQRHPERFIGLAVINPRGENVAAEVERCVVDHGMRGVKIHPRMHITPLSDPSYAPVFETAVRLGVPVASHSTRTESFNDAAQFEIVARRYPQLKLIMCHAGNDGPGVQEGIRLAARCPNIMLDTTGVGYWHAGWIEAGVRALGAGRFLYGSDLTLFDQAAQLGAIGYARLSDEDKQTILGGTLRRLIGAGA